MEPRIKTVLLLGVLTGILLLIGRVVAGTQGMTVALLFAILMNFATYFWSDKIVLFMYRAIPADETKYAKLYKMVKEIAEKSEIPMPKIYIIPDKNANAFATGRNPEHAAVACTEGIMELLNDKQLKGVIAHELSHVKNRDILIATIAATIAGAISYIASMARWAMIFSRNDNDNAGFLEIIVLTILTPIIALIIQLAISRQREYLADATGARTIREAEGLASALETLESANKKQSMKLGSVATSSLFIVNPFSGRAFITLFSTHPPVKERVRRLRTMKL